MFNGAAHYEMRTTRREVVRLYNRVVLGSSGAVSSQDKEGDAGFVVTNTGSETGRYTITLSGGAAAKLLYADAKIIGADDTAFADAKGIIVGLRDDDVSTDGTFEVQLCRNTTLADTETEDNFTILFVVEIQLVS